MDDSWSAPTVVHKYSLHIILFNFAKCTLIPTPPPFYFSVYVHRAAEADEISW